MTKSKHEYEPRAKCAGCGRPYGDANGFPDLIIEDWAWERISPTGDKKGMLCPCCILENLYDEGIKCRGFFASGGITLNAEVVEEPESAIIENLAATERQNARAEALREVLDYMERKPDEPDGISSFVRGRLHSLTSKEKQS